MKSTNGKVPVKYVTSYPAFLTPFKQYPYRRHDANLRSKLNQRLDDGDELHQQHQVDIDYLKDLSVINTKERTCVKPVLLKQEKIENSDSMKETCKSTDKIILNLIPKEPKIPQFEKEIDVENTDAINIPFNIQKRKMPSHPENYNGHQKEDESKPSQIVKVEEMNNLGDVFPK